MSHGSKKIVRICKNLLNLIKCFIHKRGITVNYCLRKNKIRYYVNLNKKKALDNKHFWKLVKSLFFDKSIRGDKINSTENGEYVKTEMKIAEVFNNFFSNIVKNLKIPQYANFDLIAQNIKGPTLKPIMKYKNHPSIHTI